VRRPVLLPDVGLELDDSANAPALGAVPDEPGPEQGGSGLESGQANEGGRVAQEKM
jgi:hypothetical protein